MDFTGTDVAAGGARYCDICESTRRQVVHQQRFVTFDHDAGLLDGYVVVFCDSCGFAYADGIPDQATFEKYYREMSRHEPSHDVARPTAPYRRHNIDMIVASVRDHLPDRSARILDVGVGNGDILLALREADYTDLTGLDPSVRTADVVQRRHNLRMLNTPVSLLRTCDERFDVILLSGVLEHFRDLRATLLVLKTLLRDSGRMFTAVPDAARFCECPDSPFQYFSIEHINFFTVRSLESLFASVGMSPQGPSRQSFALLGAFREPVIQSIFAIGPTARPPTPDVLGPERIARYVAQCRARQDGLMAGIQRRVGTDRRILIWGAGSLTMYLLSDPRFSQLDITAIVDSNENYWGRTIRGIPVLSPSALRERTEMILIVSFSYEDEIFEEIRNVHRLTNTVVRLFGPKVPGTDS